MGWQRQAESSELGDGGFAVRKTIAKAFGLDAATRLVLSPCASSGLCDCPVRPAASSGYFRYPTSVAERLIVASSMVPGFQSRAICTSAATFSVCLGMSTQPVRL